MDGRTYRPEEIQKVLERAVELQSEALSGEGETGLTLAELEELARASGIDPAFVEQAAAELDAPERQSDTSSSTHIFAERTVDGQLTDARWTELVVELRRHFETADESAQAEEERHGVTRSWRFVDGDDVKTQVYVTPREGRLHIRLSQAVGEADPVIESLVWSVIATLVLGTIASTFVDGPLLTVLGFVAAFVVSFPIIYAIDLRWRGSRERDLERVADSLARLLASGGADAAGEIAGLRAERAAPEGEPGSLIDLDELPAPDHGDRSEGRRRRVR